ncbi:glycosyltransferase [Candidatus Berkelbacteria bacterium]|nr:glycosyltransferase [Candidatus Berkelbacteria bacterium]
MKVALVHDYLIKLGGAERVLTALCELFPEAPIFTLLYDEKGTSGKFSQREVRTSFLQQFPARVKFINLYRALMPAAVEDLDLSGFDLVISDCHSFVKGVITKQDAWHISYIHTPTRFLWHQVGEGYKQAGFFLKKFLPYGLNYLRMWDFLAAKRPDFLLANSKTVARRIKTYYNREAEVIYPPVEIAKFQNKSAKEGDYFLVVSRLEPHKRVDLAVEAFNQNGKKLRIIGQGRELNRLRKMAKPNIVFLGEISDNEVVKQYQGCRALIHPQEEDFGIAMVEAMAAGKPVLAFKKGSGKELVKDGLNGLLFEEQDADSLLKALERFSQMKFSSAKITDFARQFDAEVFKEKIQKFIENKFTLGRDEKFTLRSEATKWN